jgi:hypothetical protein
VEVKNDSTAAYWFLPSGLDPNYFSPSEAAFAFDKKSTQCFVANNDQYAIVAFRGSEIWE